MPIIKRKRRAPQPNDLMTIAEFCEANRLGVTTYYDMRRRGEGPREVKIGKRRFISPQAEAEWRRQREGGHGERV